ncbi:MAG: type I methionyl aminopeptidase [bacterium]|jgi:methionyl aminopeptidase
MFTRVKTIQEVQAMRESGRMLAEVLNILKSRVAVGMSTLELNNIAASELKRLGGEPAFLGYQGFPGVLCVSINDEVVHGIPKIDTIIKNGDIVSLDFGVIYKNMITDAAISVIVGSPVSEKDLMLVKVTEKSLLEGVNQLKAGVRVGDISEAIQAKLDKNKLGIVRDLVGHGVGHELHEDPNIPNYGRKGTGPRLDKNMTIAIEPMATLGGHDVYVGDDGWTVITKDHSRSAHFEHTILITETGAEILTLI